MITIQVISQATGNPVKGARVGVAIGYTGTYHEYTDSSGEAHFSKVDPGEYSYYIDGKEFKGRLEGRKVVYV